MDILKSSRHSKITGDFAEALVLYVLSKYGFESARIDHTGIDLIARNPHTQELIGISVKSRCRTPGKESELLTIPSDNFVKARIACKAFGCTPYFAIVVDAKDTISVFLTSMLHLQELFPTTDSASGWRMSPRSLAQYINDPQIMAFQLQSKVSRWWKAELDAML